MSRSLSALLVVSALVPERASATALDAFGALPADTGWAFAVTEPAVPLMRLRDLIDVLHSYKKQIPDSEGVAMFLRQVLGFNPLDERDLAAQGIDLARGIVIHGRTEGLVGPEIAVHISLATTDAAQLREVIERLVGMMGLRQGATTRLGRDDVSTFEGFTPLGLYATPGWLHVCVGSNAPAVLKEAKRVLRAKKRLAASPVMKKQGVGVLGARGIGAWLDTGALAKAALARRAKRHAEARKVVAPDELSRLDEEAKRDALLWKGIGRIGAVLGGLSIGAAGVDGNLFVGYDKKGIAQYSKLFPRSTEPGFDLEGLARGSALAYVVQANVPKLVGWFLERQPGARAAWERAQDVVTASFAVDLMKDVVDALRGHVALVLHDVVPFTPEELHSAGSAEDRIFAHVRWALLVRADGGKLGSVVTGLVDLAGKSGEPPERREIGSMTAYSIDYKGVPFHIAVSPDTIVLGGGPGLPELAAAWAAPAAKPMDAMASVSVNSDIVRTSLEGLFTPDAVQKLHLKAALRMFRRAEPILRLLHLGTLSVRALAAGYLVEGLLHHD